MISIGQVTAEILLIWTNVPRTNVAWTNVVVTVVICCRFSQDPLIKIGPVTAEIYLPKRLCGAGGGSRENMGRFQRLYGV